VDIVLLHTERSGNLYKFLTDGVCDDKGETTVVIEDLDAMARDEFEYRRYSTCRHQRKRLTPHSGHKWIFAPADTIPYLMPTTRAPRLS